MTLSGIDVASYQETTYATAGLSFVLSKATEGTNYVNPHHVGQVATARSHGMVVGHYHFARPGSMSDQANYFLAHAGARPGDLLAFDWEDGGVSSVQKDAWVRYVQGKMPHNRVILYCNRDFWLNRDNSSFAGDGLWIADPGVTPGHPRVSHPWLIHQYSETGGMDHDVANFADAAHMRAWAEKNVVVPPAHPAPSYVPFPGATWFKMGRQSPIVAAMHRRLVAEGCDHYQSSAHQDTVGNGDVASYEAWQRKCGYSGDAAKWPPGKTTWDRLKVPKS